MIFEWFWQFLLRQVNTFIDWLYNIWPDVPPWWLEALNHISWLMGYASKFGHWVALDAFAGAVSFVITGWWLLITVRIILKALSAFRGAGL